MASGPLSTQIERPSEATGLGDGIATLARISPVACVDPDEPTGAERDDPRERALGRGDGCRLGLGRLPVGCLPSDDSDLAGGSRRQVGADVAEPWIARVATGEPDRPGGERRQENGDADRCDRPPSSRSGPRR